MIPAGYIASSPNDMANYLRMYFNDGEFESNSILSTKYLEEMFTNPHLISPDSPISSVMEDPSYGAGCFASELAGTTGYSHGGNIETYSSIMTLLPEEGFGITILVSADDVFSG